MTRVIITGAAGHIGHKIFEHLKNEGRYEVVGLDIVEVPEPDIHRADFTKYADWVNFLHAGDVIIHLAADSKPTAAWDSAIDNNINGTLNLFQASVEKKVKRIVFASSNWVHGGYRFSDKSLTPSLSPDPVNAYGVSKLFGERMGEHFSRHHGLSVICLRIGWTQLSYDNQPSPYMAMGSWGQEMWLSGRDCLNGLQKAVDVEDVPFAILNLVSNNKGMRWDINTTKEVIGYEPMDKSIPDISMMTKIKSSLLNLFIHKVPNYLKNRMSRW